MRVATVGECTSRDSEYLDAREAYVELIPRRSASELLQLVATEKIDAALWLGEREDVVERAFQCAETIPHIVHVLPCRLNNAAKYMVTQQQMKLLIILSAFEPPGVQIRRDFANRPGYADTAHILNHVLAHGPRPREDEISILQRIFFDQDCHMILKDLCNDPNLQRRLNSSAHLLGIRSLKPCMHAINAVRAFVERTVWLQTVAETSAEIGHDRSTLNRALDRVFGTHSLDDLMQRGTDWLRQTAFGYMLVSKDGVPELPPLHLPMHPAQAFRRGRKIRATRRVQKRERERETNR